MLIIIILIIPKEREVQNVVGKYGLTNKELVQFCQEGNPVITNTWLAQYYPESNFLFY